MGRKPHFFNSEFIRLSKALFLDSNLRAADRANTQHMAGTAAESPLDVHLELLEHIQRNESLDCACESTAVYSASALAVQ